MGEKHRLTSTNILLLMIGTIITIFIIYISILIISRPPIFNIFGETGEFLPTSIPVIIIASILSAIFFSFILMIPNVPIGIKIKKESKSETSKKTTTVTKSTVSPIIPSSTILTQPSQTQSVSQQPTHLTKLSPI
jgi:hypothetical protein